MAPATLANGDPGSRSTLAFDFEAETAMSVIPTVPRSPVSGSFVNRCFKEHERSESALNLEHQNRQVLSVDQTFWRYHEKLHVRVGRYVTTWAQGITGILTATELIRQDRWRTEASSEKYSTQYVGSCLNSSPLSTCKLNKRAVTCGRWVPRLLEMVVQCNTGLTWEFWPSITSLGAT